MSKYKNLTAAAFCVSILSFLSVSGCQTSGTTERIDYTYQKPIWTDASFESTSKAKR